MAKKESINVQVSQSTQFLIDELRKIGYVVKPDSVASISVTWDDGETDAIVKVDQKMWPYLKINLKQVNTTDLDRDGVKLQKTWNYRG